MVRKLIFPAPGQVGYEEVALSALGPGQVLARTVLSGVSHGTELTAFTGSSPFTTRTITAERTFRDKTPDDASFYPFCWAGYDAVGVVEQVGEGVTRYSPGDRVWRQVQHQTAFCFPEDAVDALPLPIQVADDEAIMLNLASVALNAVLDAEIKLGDAVVITGGGLVGLAAAQMAVASGARLVCVIEPLAARRALLATKAPVCLLDPAEGSPVSAIQVQNNSQPPDVVIECSGSYAGLRDAIAAAGVGGTVIAAGFYAGNAAALHLDEEFLHNRITLKASMSKWGCPSRYHLWDEGRLLRETLHLLATRKLDLSGIVSAVFPFAQAQQAYDAIRDDPQHYLKVAFSYA